MHVSVRTARPCVRPVPFCRVARVYPAPPQRACKIASSAVDAFLAAADDKLQDQNIIGAIRQYERGLQEAANAEEKRCLLWNIAAMHGRIGDLELAQVPLREALTLGLDFEAMLAEPAAGMVPWKSSRQVQLSLQKFAKTMANVEAKPDMYNPTRGLDLTPKGLKTAFQSADVGDIVGADIRGMDTSMLGIFKRVVVLLLVLVGLGVGLWFIGLEYMFPK